MSDIIIPLIYKFISISKQIQIYFNGSTSPDCYISGKCGGIEQFFLVVMLDEIKEFRRHPDFLWDARKIAGFEDRFDDL
jgi:hypothetical protein